MGVIFRAGLCLYGDSLSFGKESACRDSLPFGAGFCLHGVSLSIGEILSFEVDSAFLKFCRYRDESVLLGQAWALQG